MSSPTARDICNGSWGGAADYAPESDPLVQAAEAMTRAGVVVVFAAGNEGPKSVSADSPGIAPSSIAVGAVSTARWGNRPDNLGRSSSRGPGLGLQIKPDLVAPGEGIYSSVGGSFSTMSGTSMASPHVAGAAALLRQKHPQWTPAQIKSALMTTANTQVWSADGQDTFAGVMGQGAGRVDLEKAHDLALYLSPPSHSFGQVKAGEAETMTLAALNLLDAGQYTLTIEGPETGVTLWTTDTSPVFTAGEQKALALRLTASAEATPGDYQGRVWFEGNGRRQHVTWWVRILPAQTAADVLLLDDDGSSISSAKDHRAYYVKLLDDLGISYEVWDVGEKWRDLIRESGQPSGALPEAAALQAYKAVVWFTGDSRLSYQGIGATEMDRAAMLDYVQTGGRLLTCGQDFSGYYFVYGQDTTNLFDVGLGIEIIAPDIYPLSQRPSPYLSAEGIYVAPLLRGMRLDLGASPLVTPTLADGAGNQMLVDELAADTDYDTQPILRALLPGSTREGIIATAKSSDPSLAQSTPAMPPGRAAYLAFGLEGVNDAPPEGVASRRALFERLYDWLRDELSVSISNGEAANPFNLVKLTAAATSSLGNVGFVRYRWDLGDGSAAVESSLPSVAVAYGRAGVFHPRVEVTDSLGHTAVSAPGTVVVSPAPTPILKRTHLPLIGK